MGILVQQKGLLQWREFLLSLNRSQTMFLCSLTIEKKMSSRKVMCFEGVLLVLFWGRRYGPIRYWEFLEISGKKHSMKINVANGTCYLCMFLYILKKIRIIGRWERTSGGPLFQLPCRYICIFQDHNCHLHIIISFCISNT